jgi:hypothetical protein
LSGASKVADKVTVAMEAVGNKIRPNSQGWKTRGSSAIEQVLMAVAYKVLAEHRPAKFEQIDQTGLRAAGYGPEAFE